MCHVLRLHQLLGWRGDRGIGMGFGIAREATSVRGPRRFRLRVNTDGILPLPVRRDVDAEMSGNLLGRRRAAQSGLQRRRNGFDASPLHSYGTRRRVAASEIVENGP